MNGKSDAELLQCYAETRAEDAFAEVVRRHLDGVYSAASRRVGGDAHLAQDVAQRVFVALARKAGLVARHQVVAAWLYTVTRNEAANAVRGEQRRKARELEAMTMQDTDDQADADWSQLAPVLDAVVDELGEADRTAILLRFVDRRPFAEIGATLRVSEDAARMRVDRALEKLRTLLGRRGVTSSAGALGVVLSNHAVVAAPTGLASTVIGSAVAAPLVASPIAVALQFMITSKTVSVAVGVAVLVGWTAAVREMRARQASDLALAGATIEDKAFALRQRDAQERASRAEQARDEARAALAVAEKPVVAAPARIPAAPAADPLAAGRAFLAQHPEARELWDERERANIAAKLGPVFQVMNLTADEREQLATIFLKTISGVTNLGGPDGGVALRREPTLSGAEAQAQVIALLGEDRAKRFMELSSMAPVFDFTARLAGAVYRTDPLTPQQTGQVSQIFVRAALAARTAKANAASPIDWDAVTAEAGAVLSPPQVAALTVVRRNFEYQQAVQKVTAAETKALMNTKTGATPSR
jgi:RNA polymerase sigma factor (sigma-70 family)